jgi:hypothetical protein
VGSVNQAGGINTPAHRAELSVSSEPINPTMMTKTPIVDVATILQAGRRLDLVGSPVTLMDYKVQSVISDRGFWLGPNGEQRIFAALDDKLDLGKAELRIVVKRRQRVTLWGALLSVPSDFRTSAVKWELNEAEKEQVTKTQVYIHVNRIEFGPAATASQ